MLGLNIGIPTALEKKKSFFEILKKKPRCNSKGNISRLGRMIFMDVQ